MILVNSDKNLKEKHSMNYLHSPTFCINHLSTEQRSKRKREIDSF